MYYAAHMRLVMPHRHKLTWPQYLNTCL